MRIGRTNMVMQGKAAHIRGGDDVRAPEDDERSCEYSVMQRIEGKWLLFRVLLVISYVLFFIGYFAFAVIIKFYPIAGFTPLFTWMLVYFTWRHVSVTYRYEIVSGEMIFTKILSDRFKKKMFRLRIKTLDRIAPATDRIEKSRIEAFEPEKILWAASSMDSPDLYYAVFTDEKGKRTVLYFEATRKALQLLGHYNKNTGPTRVRY